MKEMMTFLVVYHRTVT